MRRFHVVISALIALSCVPASQGDAPLTEAERIAIEAAVRSRVIDFAEAQRTPEELCEDPTEVRDHFIYPGGRILSVSDTTPVFQTQAEWEDEGIPTSYWCSLESVDTRIDSVVVHVLRRDVAVSATPLYIRRIFKSGQSDQAKALAFETWLLTDDGWKTSSAFGYYAESAPR